MVQRKFLVCVLNCGFAALLYPLICVLPGYAEDDKKLNVAVILPLSGQAAQVGNAFQKGIELAMEEATPEERARINLIFEDDQMLPRNAVGIFQNLIREHPIDLVLNLSSQTGKALAPLAEQKKIPLVSVSRDSEVASGRKYVMSFWLNVDDEVEATLSEMKRRGYKSIARITSIHEGSLSFKRTFDQLNNGQFNIIIDDEYPVDERDFRSFCLKLRAARDKYDAVLLLVQTGQIGLLARQIRDNGVTSALVGHSIFEDQNEIKMAAGALDNAWYVGLQSSRDFYRRYRQRYPDASEFLAAHGNDIAEVLLKASEYYTDAQGVNRYLHELHNFSGALGIYSASSDNRFTLPIELKEIHPG